MSIWSGATVLVTGGTGFFGQAFIRLLLETEQPHAIRAIARNEPRRQEMERLFADDRLRVLGGCVREYDRVYELMEGVNIVVHAAALKRVETGAQQITEAIKTNVLGSMNVVMAAVRRGADRAMAISSDKASAAVTAYGATKLLTEQLFAAPHGGHRTLFACARYGNVTGSTGSVVPLFLAQRGSGRITITDPRSTRFWITIDQATRWIKRRIELMEPGCVYIPRLPSVRLVDLARAVAPDARQETIGFRGTEKVHESMIARDESRRARLVRDPDTLDYYVLGPAPHDGPEFEYTSDGNTDWLSVEEIRARLPQALADAA